MENEKNEIRVALEDGAFSLWALRQYQRATGRGHRSSLEYIIERWAILEPGAETYGITLERFALEVASAKVSPIRKISPAGDRGSAR